MSNFREMTLKWLQNGCSKNFKLLKYEPIIYLYNHFKALCLEISNIKLLSRNIQISRKYEQETISRNFEKYFSVHKIAKFEYFAKVIIYSKSPDHVL